MARYNLVLTAFLLSSVFGGTVAIADGTEVLGAPTIAIASGTGVVSAGTGAFNQPGTIDIEIPIGGTVEQVLLYWEGFMATDVVGDDTITVGGNDVTGLLIGGQTRFFSSAFASTFRADITGLGLISAGMNSISIENMDFSTANNGAGIIVIFDDGSSDAIIDIRDGSDLAFIHFASPLDTTALQTFEFDASSVARIGNLDLFFASVAGSTGTGNIRPSVIEVTVEGSGSSAFTMFDNVLGSNSGDEWDAFKIAIDLPAGANMLTLKAFSRDDLNTGSLPASFDWMAAALSVEAEVPPGVPGRMTGGGSVFTLDGTRVTRGFEIHCDLREPNNIQVNWKGNRFHMSDLTAAICIETAVDQLPRSAPFDTFQGEGVGKLNGEDGARIEFVFVDAGEPGRNDTAKIQIFGPDGDEVLLVSGNLKRGNIQAHKDNKSTF